MADFVNIPSGLNITSQIPLDKKGYCINESTLANLGVDNNLAFTYYEGLKVICMEEKTVYQWREVGVGEENTGLVTSDFTYPLSLPSTYGIDYSGRVFNFFRTDEITPETLEDYVLQIDLPEYSCQNIGIDGGPNEGKYLVQSIYNSEGTSGIDKIFRFSGIGVLNNSALKIENYSYTDLGLLRSIKGIYFEPTLEVTPTSEISGDGSILNPLKVETLNPQKVINTFPYGLTDLDDQYTLFINNAATNVVINVPDTLKDNFTCVFIQKGTGTITITGIDSSVIKIPDGLTNVIKGENYQAILEKELDTVNYYIGGSLTPLP